MSLSYFISFDLVCREQIVDRVVVVLLLTCYMTTHVNEELL